MCGGPDLVAAQKARQVVRAAVLQPQRARGSPPEQRWPSAAMAASIPDYCAQARVRRGGCAALVSLFVCLRADAYGFDESDESALHRRVQAVRAVRHCCAACCVSHGVRCYSAAACVRCEFYVRCTLQMLRAVRLVLHRGLRCAAGCNSGDAQARSVSVYAPTGSTSGAHSDIIGDSSRASAAAAPPPPPLLHSRAVVLFAIVYLCGTAVQRCAPVAAYSRVLGQSAPAGGVGRPFAGRGRRLYSCALVESRLVD